MNKVSIIKISFGTILLLSLAGCSPFGTLSTNSTGDGLPQDIINDRLNGSSWTLDSFLKSRLIESTSFTLIFDSGQVQGNAGCNSFFGSYTEDKNRIAFSDLGMTEMACMAPEGLMDQEQALLAFLGNAETFELSDGRLILSISNGETLVFESLR